MMKPRPNDSQRTSARNNDLKLWSLKELIDYFGRTILVHTSYKRNMSKNSKAISFRIQQMIRDPARSKIKSQYNHKKRKSPHLQSNKRINKPSPLSIDPAKSHSSQQQKHHPSLSSTRLCGGATWDKPTPGLKRWGKILLPFPPPTTNPSSFAVNWTLNLANPVEIMANSALACTFIVTIPSYSGGETRSSERIGIKACSLGWVANKWGRYCGRFRGLTYCHEIQFKHGLVEEVWCCWGSCSCDVKKT